MPFEHMIPHPFKTGGVQTCAPVALLSFLNDGVSVTRDAAGFVYEVCDVTRRIVRQGCLVLEFKLREQHERNGKSSRHS
jgi:hypothetical protein